MTTNKTTFAFPTTSSIEVTRTFNAPRNLVWQAWTDCAHLKHWWSPEGWALTVCEMDFRVGGSWLYCMAGEMDGKAIESWGKSLYRAITMPERIEWQDQFVDDSGNPLEGMPVGTTTTTFNDQENKTLVVSTTTYPTQSDRDAVIEMGVEQGVRETYEKLEAYLTKTTA